ncbi:taste receptor type 1 member 2-like isoform X1 [Xenopus laevis]|uniref:Taste receptor type 1 member 2-like isoform X1 n=1 Tax=Xenopus laevis TaxID=8355 RepID=A0A8J1ML83_XENLA|nr:taste receptor type 1 member 2-like isoform X1 [Xenopus laevis]
MIVPLVPRERSPTQLQLHWHLRKPQDRTQHGATFSFDENGEYITGLRIYKGITDADEMNNNFFAEFSPWAPPDQQLNITSSLIKWKTNNNEIPIAQCSAKCVPGQRKVPIPGAKTCCYDCAPCSNGEISNTTGTNVIFDNVFIFLP